MSEYGLIFWACTGAIFAGFIDAVVGGGGLVQVPVLLILFPGLSHVQVIATNRFASIAGTAVAAFQYIRSVGVDVQVVTATGICAAVSSFGGTFVMGMIRPEVFKPLLLVIITLLAIYTFFNKSMGIHHAPTYAGRKQLLLCAGIGLVTGFYNGFIGPGTGTLLVFALVALAGMSFLKGSATAKLVNAIADAASLVGFLLSKAVVFKIAIPMMVSNMVGSYIGSKMALLRGNAFVRYIFLFVISLLIIRLGWDIWRR